MNGLIESAIVSNLSKNFPSSRIYLGQVVQGIKANDIVVTTVQDDIEVVQGNAYRHRYTVATVSYINPSTDVSSKLIKSVSVIETTEGTVYVNNIDIQNEDGMTRALISFNHTER